MIDLGEAQVLEGQMAQAFHGLADAEAAAPDLLQELAEVVRGQAGFLSGDSMFNRTAGNRPG